MSDITEEEIARAIALELAAFRKLTFPDSSIDILPSEHARATGIMIAVVQPALERARREERERCAKVAESHGDTWTNSRCVETALQEAAADIQASSIAAAIRKG